jgi:competence ComEA-like helix-hairpin-helix protein
MFEPKTWSWTASQRRALIAVVAVVWVGLGVEALRWPVYVGPIQNDAGSRAGELTDRIDPNTASASELSTIPQLGPSRAAALVTYREQFLKQHPGRRAFERAGDLMKIKGIGEGIVQKLTPYLIFDAEPTQTNP